MIDYFCYNRRCKNHVKIDAVNDRMTVVINDNGHILTTKEIHRHEYIENQTGYMRYFCDDCQKLGNIPK